MKDEELVREPNWEQKYLRLLEALQEVLAKCQREDVGEALIDSLPAAQSQEMQEPQWTTDGFLICPDCGSACGWNVLSNSIKCCFCQREITFKTLILAHRHGVPVKPRGGAQEGT